MNKFNSPLFSIITPVLNNKDGIIKTIDSLKIQEFRDFEHIVVDGGSTDGTLNLLKKYKRRIRLFVNKNDTQSKAINFGIIKSKGNWITWQNSDDFYENQNALSSFAKSISKDMKLIIFSTSTLEQSLKDDFRFSAKFWKI